MRNACGRVPPPCGDTARTGAVIPGTLIKLLVDWDVATFLCGMEGIGGVCGIDSKFDIPAVTWPTGLVTAPGLGATINEEPLSGIFPLISNSELEAVDGESGFRLLCATNVVISTLSCGNNDKGSVGMSTTFSSLP
jgi:hypothetical protein